jgi:hypothetical protein
MNDPGSSSRQLRLPSGFTLIDGPDDRQVLVPKYMAAATKIALEFELSKQSLDVSEAAPGVSDLNNFLIGY